MSGDDDENSAILKALELANQFLVALIPALKANPHRMADPIKLIVDQFESSVEQYEARKIKPANPIIMPPTALSRKSTRLPLPATAEPNGQSSEQDDSATNPVFAFGILAIGMQRGTESTSRRYLFEKFKAFGIPTGKWTAFSQRVSRLGAKGGNALIAWGPEKDAHITITKRGRDQYLALLGCRPVTQMTSDVLKDLLTLLGPQLPDLVFGDQDVDRYEAMLEALKSRDDGDEGATY